MTPSPASPDFASAVTAWLKAQGEDRPIFMDDLRGQLVVGDGRQVVHFIRTGVIKAEWEANAAAERDLVLERRLLTLRRGVPTREAMRKRLFPRLKPRAEIETLELKRYVLSRVDGRDSPELSLASRAVGDAMAVQLVFQLTEESVDVSADRPAVWGSDFEALLAAALENIKSMGVPAPKQLRPGLWAMMGGGGHVSARLLLPETTAGLSVTGELVAMAPNLNLMLFADSAEPDALNQMGRLGLSASQEPFGQWGVPLVRRDGWWQVWMPEATHPAYKALSLAGLPGRVRQYAQRKELLEAKGEVDGRPETVSPLMAFQDETGEVHTSAVWVVGTVALLPKADRVAVVEPPPGGQGEPSVWSLSWAEFSQVPGVRLDRRDGVLEYWLMQGQPELDNVKAVGRPMADFQG